MSNATAIFRTFTLAESEAIASVLVEDNQAVISFQSNPDRFYTFDATDGFVDQLETILNADPMPSMGGFIDRSRKSGALQEVTV
jgi:hypothetical protein